MVERRPPRVRRGRQKRTVIASGLSACGGHSRMWGYGYGDLAPFVGTTEQALRKAVSRGEVDPSDLHSLLDFRARRQAKGGVRCKVLDGDGELVARATVITLSFGKGGVTASVCRVVAADGGAWTGREVTLALRLGGTTVHLRGRLTGERFAGKV